MQSRQFNISIHHIAIQTACFEKSFAFYTEILGLEVLKPPTIFKKKRTLAWINAGKIVIELYSVKYDEEPQAYDDRRVGTDHIAFEVRDLNHIVNYLREHGIKILRDPFLPTSNDIDQPRIAFIEGPDGEEIELREESA